MSISSTGPAPVPRTGTSKPVLGTLVLSLLGACATPAPRYVDAGGAEPFAATAAPRRAPRDPAKAPAEGDRTVAIGIGTTDSPDTFMISGDVDLYQSDRVAIGPSLQLGFDDTTAIFAPSFHAKVVFPIDRKSDDPLFMPFVQGGAGLCYMQKDRPGDDDGLGFLMQAGGGIEVRFDERYALASTLLVNILPAEVIDEHAYLSWQIVQFSFRF